MDSPRDHQPIADDRRRKDDHSNEDSTREARRHALATEISARLRRVCQHLTDEEFARLVADMTDTKLRFAAIDARAWPHPPEKR